jgi:hypothetical protein
MSLNRDSITYHPYLFNDAGCKPIETKTYKIDLGLNGKQVPLNWNISQHTKETIDNYLNTNEKNKTQMESLIAQLKRK